MPRIDLKPQTWGRAGWTFLVACAYSLGTNPSADDQAAFRLFFKSLATVLPCGSCRTNYAKAGDPDVSDGQALLTWLWTVYRSHHADVSRDDFLQKYAPGGGFKSDDGAVGTGWAIGVAVVVVVIVGFYILQPHRTTSKNE